VLKINSWLLEKSTLQSEYIIVDYLLREINKLNTLITEKIKSLFSTLKEKDIEIEIPFFKV
jgi:hypothetical protein